jgi:hypothetical protein
LLGEWADLLLAALGVFLVLMKEAVKEERGLFFLLKQIY